MTEITRLYELAGVKPEPRCEDYSCTYCDEYKECTKGKMPPFTAEKQIELIKWLGELDYLGLMRTTMETKDRIFNSEYLMSGNIYKHSSRARTFEEALAKLINSIWQDLTKEEQEQIREILK